MCSVPKADASVAFCALTSSSYCAVEMVARLNEGLGYDELFCYRKILFVKQCYRPK